MPGDVHKTTAYVDKALWKRFQHALTESEMGQNEALAEAIKLWIERVEAPSANLSESGTDIGSLSPMKQRLVQAYIDALLNDSSHRDMLAVVEVALERLRAMRAAEAGQRKAG